MSTYSVGFDIFAKDRASDVFDKVGGKADDTAGRLSQFKDKAMVAGAAAGVALVAFGKSSMQAYVDAEKSQRVLEDAYARFPAVADVPIEKMREMAAALQNKTKFDGDDINAMQGKLASYGLTGAELAKLTPLVLDYAEKTGKDLPTASEDMGKAILGQTRALKAIGLDLDDTGSKTGNLDQLMGGLRKQVGGFAEQEGASAEGKAEILKNKFGDLQESIGKKLMPAAEKLTDWLDKAVTFIGDNSTAIGGLVVTVLTIVGAVKAWSIAQGILNFVLTANPIGLVVIAVAALAAGIVWVATQTTFFQDAWKVMTDAVGAAWRWLWNSILAPIIRFVLNGFANIAGGIANFLRALSNIPGFGWAKDAADKMDGAAAKARALARGINDIPDYKGVTIKVVGKADAAAMKAMGLVSSGGGAKARALMYGERARGGPIVEGQPYLVGEEGPEFIVPEQDGQVLTASQSAALLANRGAPRAAVAGDSGSETVLAPLHLEVEGETLVKVLLRIKRTRGGGELGIA